MQIWCQKMPLDIVPNFSNENLVSKNEIMGSVSEFELRENTDGSWPLNQ
jgi:hypothetical protein